MTSLSLQPASVSASLGWNEVDYSPSGSGVSSITAPSKGRAAGGRRKIHVCGDCKYQTYHLSNFKDHRRIHTGDYIKCPLCPCRFFSRSNYGSHMKGHAGLLKCKTCGKQYTSLTGLQCHKRVCGSQFH